MPIIIPAAPGSTSALQSVPTQQVFDYLYDSRGNPIKGVQVVLTLGAANATSITPQVELSSVVVRVTTDQNGFWSANLIPNANINPANTTYLVQPPGLDAYSISIPSAGGPFQSTSPAVLVNTPGVLAPATTGITGNLTVSGNETVTGTLTVAGVTTLASTTTGALSTAAASIGGDLTIQSAFRLLMLAAASKLVPGATSFSVRNNADNADNVLITDAGAATVRNGLTVTAGDTVITAGRLLLNAAAAKIKGGATSLSLRNNADSADNVLITDAGNVTVRGTVTTSTTPFHAEVHQTSNQVVSDNVTTIVSFDAVDADPNSNFNAGTSRYTCPAAGRVRVSSTVTWLTPGAKVNPLIISVYKNASEARRGTQLAPANGDINPAIHVSAPVTVAQGDILDVRVLQHAGVNYNTSAGLATVWATFEYIGP